MTSILDELAVAAGEEGLEQAVFDWLARFHRRRPRPHWAKPDAPARAPHYLAWVREQPCARCPAPPPSEPHHCGPRGLGQKTDDYRVVPLCRRCHDAAHTAGRAAIPRLHQMTIDTMVRYLRAVEGK